MKILFLYTELADYTLACLKELEKNPANPDIHIVHYPVNSEAPFDFDFAGTCTFSSIKTFDNYSSLKHYVDAFQPDKIIVSGWANKWYVRICLAYRKKAVCILTMDNHWVGSFKQRVFICVFRLSLIKVFKKIWVPGKQQVLYAKKLGFKEADIIEGFYCCDTDLYLGLGSYALALKKIAFPKRLLCVARYISKKNYEILWDAFIEWKEETNNDWELWCAGIGEDFEQRKLHPAIRHLGFVQKEDWGEIISQTGVFVLPSTFEPWGVVVHEFAASGYPLLLSKNVGAGGLFLSSANGWTFDPENKKGLVSQLKKISALTTEELYFMGKASGQSAQQITLEKWAATLVSM